MALDNYTGLVDEVAAWLHRGDLTARIPTFLQLAEGELRLHPAVYKQVTEELTLTVDQSAYDFGTDLPNAPGAALEAVLSIAHVGEEGGDCGGPLANVSPDEIARQRFMTGKAQGAPTAFAFTSKNRVVLYPTPDSDYVISVSYKLQLPSLTALAPVNWLLVEHPQLYLYSVLLQAEPFLINDERVPLWASKVADGLKALEAKRGEEQFPTQIVRRPKKVIGRIR